MPRHPSTTQITSLARREFLRRAGTLAATAGALALAGWTPHTPARAAQAGARLKKSLKYGMIGGDGTPLDKFRLAKEAGFDGVELDSPSAIPREQFLEASRAAGLPIDGLVDSVHWRQTLSDPDPAVRSAGREALEVALSDAKFYGATTVLLVPAVVNAQVSYDQAYERSQAEIRRVLPLATELDVVIAIENVWNHFLLSPLEMARYIDEFESPHVGVQFDVGNIVNYGWPEQWIRILGPRIVKLDIKEFSRKRRDEEGLWKGFDVPIGEGDTDWPAVMAALAEIGFEGWAAAEVPGGGLEQLSDIARRMDRVFSG